MNKLDGRSADIKEMNVQKLKEIFPESVSDGMIDFNMLKQLLGEYVDDSEERYRFVWNGKGEALRLSQTPSMGTLRPAKDENESKNWDTTENLYIEGENLEVLKLLQKSYFGKIKMIYIDPPYNTGKDFVYPDDFKDSIENYKKITGQVDENNSPTTTNPEYSGRYHTDWLNMMYPRLRLAKNLLSDDGVIFISIDDNEVHNLRKICDEVFGEDNFVAMMTWIKKKKGSHLSKTIRNMTEYVLVYGRDFGNVELFGEKAYSDKWQPLAKRTNSHKKLSIDKNVVLTTLDDGTYNKGFYGKGSSSLEFLGRFHVRDGVIIDSIVVNGPFVWTQEKLNRELEIGTKISLSSKFGFNVFRSNQDEKIKRPTTILDNKSKIGTNEDAYNELKDILKEEKILDYPKPVSLIKYVIHTLGYFDKNMLVLDFFAGSATTAHAVMQLNAEDGGNRKFIMVQLPEPTDENSEAYKAGYKNISEIGKERIRRAGDRIKEELEEKYNQADEEERKNMKDPEDLDIGFKVFKLDSSNIKEWNPGKYDDIQMAIEDSLNPYVEGRTEEDVVYEMMLKMGVDLTYPIEEYKIEDKTIYSIGFGSLMICLSKNIDLSVAEKMIELKKQYEPEIWRVIFKDGGFNSDKDKTNIKETLKSAGLQERSFLTL